MSTNREFWVAYPFNGDGAFSIYFVGEDSDDGFKAAAEQMRLTTHGEGVAEEAARFAETDFDPIEPGAEVHVDGVRLVCTENDWDIAR